MSDGCVGTIQNASDPSPSTAVDAAPPATEAEVSAASDALTFPPFVPAASRLRRLPVAQYQNSVRDLLGSTVRVSMAF
jgi:hypothetical protein